MTSWRMCSVVLVLVLAACSSKDDEVTPLDDRGEREAAGVEPTPAPESVKPKPPTGPTGPIAIELTFTVELDPGASLDDVVTTIGRRIEQRQPTTVEVAAAGEAVVLRLPALADDELERTWRRLIRPAKIAYRIVDDGSDVMRQIYQHVRDEPADKSRGIDALVDQWNSDATSTSYTDYYLAAADKNLIVDYLAALAKENSNLAPASDHMIAYQLDHAPPDRVGPEWRTYYVSREASLATDAIERSELMFDQTDERAEALLTFTEAGTVAFAELTRNNIGKKLAIFVDDAIVSAPVIMSEIPGGQTAMSSGGDAETAKRDAEELVELLKLGVLPARLTLKDTKKL